MQITKFQIKIASQEFETLFRSKYAKSKKQNSTLSCLLQMKNQFT